MQNTPKEISSALTEILTILKKQNDYTKNWLRTNETCDYLSISRSQLYTLVTDGVLSVRKIGGTNYYSREEIDNILAKDEDEVEV